MNKSRSNFAIFCVTTVVVFIGVAAFLRTPKSVMIKSPPRTVMGTYANIVAIGQSDTVAKTAILHAFDQLDKVNSLMSDYDPTSELSMVNKNAFEKPVAVSDELFEVLKASVHYSEVSGGAFDVTVGPVVLLWRDARKQNKMPDAKALEAAKAKVGYKNLILDEASKTVRFGVEGMVLDLGGIAKGYGIDLAVEAMKKAGAIGGMVDVGGDIMCFGKPPEGKDGWYIGLQDPGDDTKLMMKLSLNDTAIATSGDYRRFVLLDGQRYSHIIDPVTIATAGELSSVSIFAATAMKADALATTVSVMGPGEGMALIEGADGVEAILMSAGQGAKMSFSSGAKSHLMPVQKAEGDN